MQLGIRSLLCLLALFFSGLTNVWAQKYESLSPLPETKEENKDKILLGKKLYYTQLFSKNNQLSCASCHIIPQGGSDNLPKYIGLDQKVGSIHTPTILNASLNFRQFWDGRAKTLEDVIEDHLQDKTIFASSWPEVIDKIKDQPNLNQEFKEIYKHSPTPEDIKDALAAFLKTLLTPESPFDRYLKGDKNAISANAKKGYQLFKEFGCITCHEGPNLGGNLFQRMGVYQDYFANRTNINEADLGRFNVTGKEEDKFVFKVPTLRNVALTAPYFHDGSAKNLKEAIQTMGIYEVGQPIPEYEVSLLIKFLETLTSNIPAEFREEKR